MAYKEYTPQQAGAEYDKQQVDSLLMRLGNERKQAGWRAVKETAKLAVLGFGAGLTIIGGVGIAMANPGGYMLLPGGITLAGAVKSGFHEANVSDSIDDWRSAAGNENAAREMAKAGRYTETLNSFGTRKRT